MSVHVPMPLGVDNRAARGEPQVANHIHTWAAYRLHFGFLMSRCWRCGGKWFVGGYGDPRCDAITDRLNRSWRVR